MCAVRFENKFSPKNKILSQILLKFAFFSKKFAKKARILKFLTLILTLFLGLLLSACASKASFSKSQAVYVVLNSPQIKFADAGFLYQNPTETRLEVYKLAQALFALHIKGSKICLNGFCTSKGSFNEKFFQNAHYDELLSDILSSKPLYNGLNLKKNECGFEQKITSKSAKFDIFYQVCDEKISFNDKKARLKFTLTRMENE